MNRTNGVCSRFSRLCGDSGVKVPGWLGQNSWAVSGRPFSCASDGNWCVEPWEHQRLGCFEASFTLAAADHAGQSDGPRVGAGRVRGPCLKWCRNGEMILNASWSGRARTTFGGCCWLMRTGALAPVQTKAVGSELGDCEDACGMRFISAHQPLSSLPIDWIAPPQTALQFVKCAPSVAAGLADSSSFCGGGALSPHQRLVYRQADERVSDGGSVETGVGRRAGPVVGCRAPGTNSRLAAVAPLGRQTPKKPCVTPECKAAIQQHAAVRRRLLSHRLRSRMQFLAVAFLAWRGWQCAC